MKYIIIAFILLFSLNIYSREAGETEITTDEGIEVFQEEKYYILKKNVKIVSDNFILFGDKIKISFDKDLYDIKMIEAYRDVELQSPQYGIVATGQNLLFDVKKEKIQIEGNNSELLTKDTKMYSDGIIRVKNISGDFFLNGPNSKLINDDIFIEGERIDGIFETKENSKEILVLNVLDNEISYIKTEDTSMYAKIINYNKENSLIELKNSVKIIRNGEKITGDYGTLDTNTNSYKIKSNNSKKVKVVISNSNE